MSSGDDNRRSAVLNHQAQSLFLATTYVRSADGLITGSVLLLIGISFVGIPPLGFFGGGVCFILSAYKFMGFYVNWNREVRRAEFHESDFRVVRRGQAMNLMYSDIAKVSLIKKNEPFLNPTRINIKMNDGAEFVIFGNPRNPGLRMNLFTWLGERVGRNESETVARPTAATSWSNGTRSSRFLRISGACAGALFLLLFFSGIFLGGPTSGSSETWYHSFGDAILYNIQYLILLFLYAVFAGIIMVIQRPPKVSDGDPRKTLRLVNRQRLLQRMRLLVGRLSYFGGLRVFIELRNEPRQILLSRNVKSKRSPGL